MEPTELHIGAEIKRIVQEKGLSLSEFGRRIDESRQNVQSLYKRKSIDSDKLQQISIVLNTDFFSYYQRDIKQISIDKPKFTDDNVLQDLAVSYKAIPGKSEETTVRILLSQNSHLIQQVNDLIRIQMLNAESIRKLANKQ